MEIRKTETADLNAVMAVYRSAQDFMAGHGNPSQWGTFYPERSLIESDIKEGTSYVCTEGGQIAAVFTFRVGPDATYARIYDGHWLDDAVYGVVHRIASSHIVRGSASFCIEWAFRQCGNIRIDTHRDNIPMQHLLQKLGYTYCGIIHTYDGTGRLAYQKTTVR